MVGSKLFPTLLLSGLLFLLVPFPQSSAQEAVAESPAGLPATPGWTARGGQANAQFGSASATAGDVNGDGYSDLLIGAPLYDGGQTDEGRVSLFLGSDKGLAATPAWTAEGNAAAAQFGYAVSTAGDVNGDGFADVIVGAPHWANGQANEGRAYVYYGSPAGLAASANWTYESNLAGALFGWSVAVASDVNGDGYGDVIIGAPQASNGQQMEGIAYVFLGSAAGLQPSPAWQIEGEQTGALLGYSVATAGDVNVDGFADVIIGAPGYDKGQVDEGIALAYYGSAAGLPGSPNWTVQGNQNGAQLGFSVATTGDVKGSGVAGVIVGAPGYDNGQNEEGRAYLYYGSFGSGLSTSAGYTVESDQVGAQLGYSVGLAGDLDGDGYSDVAMGAPYFDNGQTDEGRVFVYWGWIHGPTAVDSWHAENDSAGSLLGWAVAPAGDVNGDGYSDLVVGAPKQGGDGGAVVYQGAADGLVDVTWGDGGDTEGAYFGYAVASAGDVNGDGYADVIVGSPGFDNGQVDEGQARFYLGQMSGLSTDPAWTVESDNGGAQFGYAVAGAGDVNGDGYSDVAVGAPLYTRANGGRVGRVSVYCGSAQGIGATACWTAEGAGDGWFGAAVAGAGDVNGDGYDDLLVGEHGYSPGGRALLYYGSSVGLQEAPGWSFGLQQGGARCGTSVAGAGDVNGDGYADLLVGAPLVSQGQQDEGAAVLFYGSPTGPRPTPVWSAASNQSGAQLGFSVSTAGDVNGDGFADMIVGAPFASNGQANEGRVFIYYGGASGPGATANWIGESNQAGACYGWSVASSGDVNGDGYADVVVGAPYYDDYNTENAGTLFSYLGQRAGMRVDSQRTVYNPNNPNGYFGFTVAGAGDTNGDGYADVLGCAPHIGIAAVDAGTCAGMLGNDYGVAVTARQREVGGAPIAPEGRSKSSSQFRITAVERSPFGRTRARMEWEVKPTGVLFDGQNTSLDPQWLDTLYVGRRTDETVSGLKPNTAYHWRIRFHYDPVTSPFLPASRWIASPWNGWNETDLRMAASPASTLDLPLILR